MQLLKYIVKYGTDCNKRYQQNIAKAFAVYLWNKVK